MRIVLIGRTSLLIRIGREALNRGHTIVAIVTAKESPESTDDSVLIRSFANEISASYFNTWRLVNIHSELEALGSLDIGLSVNYVSIIDDLSIAKFQFGILNAHGGDLPRYRGNACQAWAILNGEESVGLCIHKMIGGLIDSGDIVQRDYLKINEATYIGEIIDWINSQSPIMMLNAAEILEKDPTFALEKQSLDLNDSLRTFPRNPDDALITWSDSKAQILRLIRASSSPYLGAFSYIEGKKIVIWRAKAVSHPPISSVAGQIVDFTDYWFDVSVSDGSEVIRVEYATVNGSPLWRNHIKSIRQRLA
jgi:methionyl-tRNA formyltransferase